jgi:hypothetical protein
LFYSIARYPLRPETASEMKPPEQFYHKRHRD